MATVSDDNGLQVYNRCRTCLLTYPCAWEDGQPYPNEHLNPLPALKNLHVAYTIPPIRAFWYPLRLDTSALEMCAVYAHESLHSYLSDTTILGHYTTILSHFQYASILRALESNTPISIPSLQEPTGRLAKAQSVLEQIHQPMALIHELMATTLVRFWAEKGWTYMRPHFTALLSRISFGISADKAANTNAFKTAVPVERGSPFVAFQLRDIEAHLADLRPERTPARFTRSYLGPKYTKVIERAEAEWLSFYPDAFQGRDFYTLYERLLNTWRQIDVVEGEALNSPLHLSLSRYPFQISPALEMISASSLQTGFDSICSYMSQMKEEPLRRLELLLKTVEEAKQRNLHGRLAWEAYLKESLPGFAASLASNPLPLLYKSVYSIWQEFKHNPPRESLVAIGKIALSQLIPNEPTIILCSLPVENSDTVYRFENQNMDEEAVKALEDLDWRVLLMLEALRESLLEFQGITCLCEPEVREYCILRRWLERLWTLATPDPEYREWFEQHWQKPACMAVESFWNRHQVEISIGQQRLTGDVADKVLTLASHRRFVAAKSNFPMYGAIGTAQEPDENGIESGDQASDEFTPDQAAVKHT